MVRREDKPTSTGPGAPFITSTLQQAASTRLGFAVRKTMTLAQRLYEAGHITYMRTDSTNLSRAAVGAVREYIESEHGKDYLSPQPAVYASKAAAQEAHEAIRPTDVQRLPASLGSLPAEQRRLYDLIWRQFVACQMARAQYLSTTVAAEGDGFEVRARGRIMRFDGYTRVAAPQARKDDDRLIPEFAEGDRLRLADAEVIQHFTKPPPRYGRRVWCANWRNWVSAARRRTRRSSRRIQERGYVTLEKRRFRAERIGELVTDRLVENFSDLMDYSFTAGLEGELDRIADGDRAWRAVLDGSTEASVTGSSRRAPPKGACARTSRRAPTCPVRSAVVRCRYAPRARASSSAARATRCRRRNAARTR